MQNFFFISVGSDSLKKASVEKYVNKGLSRFFLIVLLQIGACQQNAFAQQNSRPVSSDSLQEVSPRVRPGFPYRTVISAGMITYGALAIHSSGLKNINEEIISVVGKPQNRKTLIIDNYLAPVPFVATYAIKLFGEKGLNSFGEAVVIGGIAVLIGNGVLSATKSFDLETRPDGSNKRSFPSGHTANAFIGAELMRKEFRDKPWYGVAGYSVATVTGILRVYNRKHWFSDVVAGAGVGILSTQAAYKIYPLIKKITGNRGHRVTYILPSISRDAIGVYSVMLF